VGRSCKVSDLPSLNSRAYVQDGLSAPLLCCPLYGSWPFHPLHRTASGWAPCRANAASGWRPFLPVCSASVASSYVPPTTLLGERLLRFQLNRNSWRYPETVRWAARHDTARTSYSTLISTKLNPAAMHLPLSPIPRIHSMRRLSCAALRKTPLMSRRSMSRAQARRPLLRLSVPTGPCSATSHTVKKDCLSRTSTSRWPPASSRRAADPSPRRTIAIRCPRAASPPSEHRTCGPAPLSPALGKLPPDRRHVPAPAR